MGIGDWGLGIGDWGLGAVMEHGWEMVDRESPDIKDILYP